MGQLRLEQEAKEGKYYRIKSLMDSGFGHSINDVGIGIPKNGSNLLLRVPQRTSTSYCEPYVEYYPKNLEEVTNDDFKEFAGRFHNDVGKKVSFGGTSSECGSGTIIWSNGTNACIELITYNTGVGWGLNSNLDSHKNKGIQNGKKYWIAWYSELTWGELGLPTGTNKGPEIFKGSDIYVSDVVVSLVEMSGSRAKGQMFVVMGRSSVNNLAYSSAHSSGDASGWRKATREEAAAFVAGERFTTTQTLTPKPTQGEDLSNRLEVGQWVQRVVQDTKEIIAFKAYVVTHVHNSDSFSVRNEVGGTTTGMASSKNWTRASAPVVQVVQDEHCGYKVGDWICRDATDCAITGGKPYQITKLTSYTGWVDATIVNDCGTTENRTIAYKKDSGGQVHWKKCAAPRLAEVGTWYRRVDQKDEPHVIKNRPYQVTSAGDGYFYVNCEKNFTWCCSTTSGEWEKCDAPKAAEPCPIAVGDWVSTKKGAYEVVADKPYQIKEVKSFPALPGAYSFFIDNELGSKAQFDYTGMGGMPRDWVKCAAPETRPTPLFKMGDWVECIGLGGSDITKGRPYQLTRVYPSGNCWIGEFKDDVGDTRNRTLQTSDPSIKPDFKKVDAKHPFNVGDWISTTSVALSNITPRKSYQVNKIGGDPVYDWWVEITSDAGTIQQRSVQKNGKPYNGWTKSNPLMEKKPKHHVWAEQFKIADTGTYLYLILGPRTDGHVNVINLTCSFNTVFCGNYEQMSDPMSGWKEAFGVRWNEGYNIWVKLCALASKRGCIDVAALLGQVDSGYIDREMRAMKSTESPFGSHTRRFVSGQKSTYEKHIGKDGEIAFKMPEKRKVKAKLLDDEDSVFMPSTHKRKLQDAKLY